MAGFFNKKKHRTLIPRWRLFAVTTQLGELNSVRDAVRPQLPSSGLDELVSEFGAHQTLWHAFDLLSAAFAAGQPEAAHAAAEFILARRDEAAEPVIDLALTVVGHPARAKVEATEWKDRVRYNRRSLVEHAADSTRWADLGLAHTILGNRQNAIRSLTVATQLAPRNRFVVRAAVRCFMHWGEPDRAQAALRIALEGNNDPWLLAADIATTVARRRRPRNVNVAKLVAEDRSIHFHHVSELATAIASLEVESGSARRAKPFLRIGMEDPTENSVAQLEWIITERNIDAPSIEHVESVPLLFEAKARDRYADGDWRQALYYATKWLNDQPFSSRPADMAAYAAALLQEYDVAVGFLEKAMRSNPGEPMMINNLAYFQIMANRVGDALQTFARLDGLELTEDIKLVTQATKGLLCIRTGDIDQGRHLYRRTLDQSWAKKKRELRVLAMLNLAREERRLTNIDEAQKLLDTARQEARHLTDKEIETTLRTTEAYLGAGAEVTGG